MSPPGSCCPVFIQRLWMMMICVFDKVLTCGVVPAMSIWQHIMHLRPSGGRRRELSV